MHFIIVGAGPAGLGLAYLLARGGERVTVLERETDFSRVFRGEGLMPSGLNALDAMGMGESMKAVPGRDLESWHIYMGGEEILVIPEAMDPYGDRGIRLISQPALLDAFVEEASAYPGFELRKGATVTGLIEEEGRIRGLKVTEGDGQSEIRGDLVVGCDGRNSTVRRRAGVDLQLLPEDYDILWMKMPAPRAQEDACAVYFLMKPHTHPAIAYISWDGRLQLGLVLPKGGYLKMKDRDLVEESVRSSPAWLAKHVLDHREAIEGPIVLNVLVGRARQWSKPGLLLIGDAAHPMSPVRAQGINVAIRDSIIASNHLLRASRNGAGQREVDLALKAIQDEREPEIIRSQKLQHRESKGLKDMRAGNWKYHLGRFMASRMGKYRWAQRNWMAQQKDLRYGTKPVRIEE